MRIATLSISFILLLCLPLQGASAQSNIISNGSFEDGLEGWSSFGNVTVSEAESWTGSASLETNDSTQSTNFIYQELDLQYENHSISLWVFPVDVEYKFGFELVRDWDFATSVKISRVKATELEIEFTALDVDTTVANSMSTGSWNKLEFRVDAANLRQDLFINDSLVASLTSSELPAVEHLILGDLSAEGMFGHLYYDGISVTETVTVGFDDAVTPRYRSPVRLLSNYPNPFSDRTNISVLADKLTVATIRVIDIAGRLVDIIMDGTLAEGSHNISWRARDVPSGIYFIQLEAEGYSVSVPVVVN